MTMSNSSKRIIGALRTCCAILAIAAAPLGAQSMGKAQSKPASAMADSQHSAMASPDTSMKKPSAMQAKGKGMAHGAMGKSDTSKSQMKKPTGANMQKPDHPTAAMQDTSGMKRSGMSKDSTSQMKKPRA